MSLALVLIAMFAMILAGVPIAFTMISISIVYFLTSDFPMFVNVVPQKIFEGIDSIVFTAIPFFLLAGELMNRSGMADRLLHFSNLIIGRVRGGFAYVNVVASLLFSGLTGVAVGDIAALGKIEVRAMEKAGYPRAFAAAVTVSSALVGPIIPPSGAIIIYCAIMDVSVGGMFLAALIPGVLMAAGDMLVIFFQARARKFPTSQSARSLPELAKGTKDAAFALLMPVILIGGIVGGIMTPTEAAAGAVIYALLIGVLVYRAFGFRDLYRALATSGFEAARLLFLIGGALTMSWIFALEDASGFMRDLLSFAQGNQLLLIITINILFLILGMFMEGALIVILFGPVVAPLAYHVGVTDLQLGIMLLINVTVGLATPPVGNVLFAMSGIARVNLGDLIKFALMVLVGLTPALTNAVPAYFGMG